MLILVSKLHLILIIILNENNNLVTRKRQIYLVAKETISSHTYVIIRIQFVLMITLKYCELCYRFIQYNLDCLEIE